MATDVKTQEKTSPMMQQWNDCKQEAKQAVLFFRLGDFYEAFYEDATTLANELGVTLTQRQGIPMAGVPFHASEAYIDKLIAKGYNVAIAEQVEDPKATKGIVKREVVRRITPGTVINSSLLSEKSNNFIGCLTRFNQTLGLSVLDITTAEFVVFEFESFSSLVDELSRLKLKELIVSEKMMSSYKKELEALKTDLHLCLSSREVWHFDPEQTHARLLSHFKVLSLESFGIQGMDAALHAAGSLLAHVKEELNVSIDHIQTIQKHTSSQYMSLDSVSLRHLEILDSLHEKQSSNTLFHLMDHTKTPMGARLLKHWLCHPLLCTRTIRQRQECVRFFVETKHRESLSKVLSGIKDLERLIMKVETGFAGPKDLLGLKLSLEKTPEVAGFVTGSVPSLLLSLQQELAGAEEIASILQKALSDNPPFRLSDGGVIREGFHSDLDELRALASEDHLWIANYQAKLKETTQIKTLKVGFNKAFGYYIEVSRGQADKMPDSFQRRQTLINAERFISPELKEYERKVLSAGEKIAALEASLYETLKAQIGAHGSAIRRIARALGQIDTLNSLAETAYLQDYTCPVVDEGNVFSIEEGRHPVIEASLRSESFIPNDTFLDAERSRLFVITGPNMSGKSTFIRQVALIAILAQIGSFVPAKHVHIGLLDKVFTRIGASDNLTKGQSTFMVEMTETANILHNATDRSLVILDEIGRGTSTYDGISIAWAVAEYLLTTPGKQAKTLFATHYCELTELEEKVPGAINYNVDVHESDTDIVFLRKIVRGGTDKSYGLHVGKLAGLPVSLLHKAQSMLHSLEKTSHKKRSKALMKEPQAQMSLFKTLSPSEENILRQLKELNPNEITPLEALQTIIKLKNEIK